MRIITVGIDLLHRFCQPEEDRWTPDTSPRLVDYERAFGGVFDGVMFTGINRFSGERGGVSLLYERSTERVN